MATKKATSSTAAKKPAKSSAAEPETKKAPAKKAAAKKSVETTDETPAKGSSKSAKSHATHDEISKLAHSYWEKRGHHHGSHVDDWLRAEKELNS